MSSKKENLIDLEFIKDKVIESIKYVDQAHNQDVVLVLGCTGSGKSTLSNFIAGNKMHKVTTEDGMEHIDTVEETNIKIGHSTESETLFMTVLIPNNSEKKICLIDSAGFFNTHSKEHKIVESLCTECIIQNTQDVKGFLIVIKYSDFKSARLVELRNLVKMLGFFFKDLELIAGYSVLVITHCDEHKNTTKNFVVQRIRSAVEACRNKTNVSNNSLTCSSEELASYDDVSFMHFFSKLIKNESRILLVDYLDNGESRENILTGIKSLVSRKKDEIIHPLGIKDFNFVENDEHRKAFTNALYSIAKEGNESLSTIQQTLKKLKSGYDDVSECEKRLILLKQQLNSLNNLEDTNKSIEPQVKRPRLFGSVDRAFTIKSDGISPNVQIIPTERGGKWDEILNRANVYYSVDCLLDASIVNAEIEVTIVKRGEWSYKTKTVVTEKIINDLNLKRTNVNDAIFNVVYKIAQNEMSPTRDLSEAFGTKKVMEDELHDCKISIKSCESDINKHNEAIQRLKDTVREKLTGLYENNKTYDVLVKIVNVLKLQENFIQLFISEYCLLSSVIIAYQIIQRGGRINTDYFLRSVKEVPTFNFFQVDTVKYLVSLLPTCSIDKLFKSEIEQSTALQVINAYKEIDKNDLSMDTSRL